MEQQSSLSSPKSKEKAYLYHMLPENMEGTVLLPLTALREKHPELYKREAEKYKGREWVRELFIPTLEAAWNDVVFLTAIKPEDLKRALTEAGHEPREMKFYQIDPELLDPQKTTVYLYRDPTVHDDMSPENFTEFNPETVHEHSQLPEGTKAYYRKKFEEGERPLLFVGVPHILHKGSIDVSNLSVITV